MNDCNKMLSNEYKMFILSKFSVKFEKFVQSLRRISSTSTSTRISISSSAELSRYSNFF